MPIGGRINITPVSDGTATFLRKTFVIGWVFCIGVTPWLIRQHVQLDAWKAVILSVVSIPLGYHLGYRWGIGPLFSALIQHPSSKAGT